MDLNNDDAVFMSDPDFQTGTTFKVSELKEKVRSFVNQETKGNYISSKLRWFSEGGAKCEVLRLEGGGWQKGRLRFRLEFIPDEPVQSQSLVPTASSSPLDDLRSNLEV
ncbi:MAG: hypothetical protein FWK04_08575 [Nostoc sp. GBBB01]|nr:hypothetical protein [Nostoc sp. GBBB01]